MRRASISVVMPARDEGGRVAETLTTIAAGRATSAPVEVVIVDDASTDGCCAHLAAAGPGAADLGLNVRVIRTSRRLGVPQARNLGAAHATGEILFITDAHVRFPYGWDRQVFHHIRPERILAATIRNAETAFRGYGCRLLVPLMDTAWIRERPAGPAPVQIAACPGTVLHRDLFQRIGGYDPGMGVYGAAEPEFSVRAWLSGAEIIVLPELHIFHRFRPPAERKRFLAEVRADVIYNSVRFGLLYLPESLAIEMIRYYCTLFPGQAGPALQRAADSDVFQRRQARGTALARSFDWYVVRFGLLDQAGKPVPLSGVSEQAEPG